MKNINALTGDKTGIARITQEEHHRPNRRETRADPKFSAPLMVVNKITIIRKK